MSQDSRTSAATWIGTVSGSVSAATAVFTAYRLSSGRIGGLLWAGLTLAEAVVICALALYILRKRPVSIPRGVRVENRKLMESLFRTISDDFEDQVSELAKSQLSLYGRQVRNAQVHLLDALSTHHRSPAVFATDIVRRLDLWPTRGVYRAANARFIQNGGSVSRIFLIGSDLIGTDEDAKAFWEIMSDHRAMGVSVALHIIDILPPECVEDYVIYARDCVLVELEQGDVDFSRGKVTAYFGRRWIELYVRRFRYLDAPNDTKAARDILALYEKYFVDQSMAGLDFADRKARFLREVR